MENLCWRASQQRSADLKVDGIFGSKCPEITYNLNSTKGAINTPTFESRFFKLNWVLLP
jgi:hypothetical protein